MYEPQIKVEIKGVVIPTWLAICLLLVATLSAVTLLLNWRQQVLVERELRILQLHISDIENVMIREGIATRADFAQWTSKSSKESRGKPK